MAASKERVNSLTTHLEKTKETLNSTSIPDRHKGKEQAYREFLRREISRTQKSLENLKPSTGK